MLWLCNWECSLSSVPMAVHYKSQTMSLAGMNYERSLFICYIAVMKGCALTDYDCVCVMWKHVVTCMCSLKYWNFYLKTLFLSCLIWILTSVSKEIFGKKFLLFSGRLLCESQTWEPKVGQVSFCWNGQFCPDIGSLDKCPFICLDKCWNGHF